MLFRTIFKNKTYSLLNIFGLAAGIASATLILLWVEDEVKFDRIYPDSGHLYMLGNKDKHDDKTYTSFVASNPLAEALSSDFPGIRDVTRCEKVQSFLSVEGNQGFKEEGCFVDSTFFSMFGVETRGSVAAAFTASGSIAVSERLAGKLFGKDDPIGKAINIDGGNHGYVCAVFKDFPGNSSFRYEWLRPFDEILQQYRTNGQRGNINNWFSHWMTVYVALEPATTASVMNEHLDALIKEKTGQAEVVPFVYPLSDMRLYGEFADGKPTGGGYIRTIKLFAAIACIILLIACINYMNLATARSEKRLLEVGVCKALGAKRSGLMVRFMRESALITLISLLLSILIVWVSLPAFNHLVGKELSLQFFNPLHTLGLLGIALLCTLLAGSYPAFYLSSFHPLTAIKKIKIKSAGSVAWVRKGLVVFQFSVTFILIAATITIYQQIKHIQNRPLGYEKEQVVMVEANEKVVAGFQAIQNELNNTGVVMSAALSHGSILNINSGGSGFKWQGKPENMNPSLTRMYACPGFVETVGLHIFEGRDFSAENEADQKRVLINRQLAELMGEEGHVGRLIGRGGQVYEIAGVVDNFVFNDIYATANEPVIFFNIINMPQGIDMLNVRVKQGVNMQQAIGAIEKVVSQFAGGEPFTYTFMDEAFGHMFSALQREGRLAVIFSALAIFISCLGLFGLSAFSAEQRTREIGIRKVMGATIGNITGLLTKEFLILVGIAMLIAFPLAYYWLGKMLQEYAYRIDIRWWMFALAGIITIVLTLLTVGWKAMRAAMANPVKSLKTE